MRTLFAIACLITAGTPLIAQQVIIQPKNKPQIDYNGFLELTGKVAAYRQKRLIQLPQFNKKAASKDVLILDTRSAQAFKFGHIKGAVNLPFSDFTDEKLAKVIGKNKDREILIYCNNNFSDNLFPVAMKNAPLALNIPTFINLYGYGYKNIYELDGSYKMSDPDVQWVSPILAKPL